MVVFLFTNVWAQHSFSFFFFKPQVYHLGSNFSNRRADLDKAIKKSFTSRTAVNWSIASSLHSCKRVYTWRVNEAKTDTWNVNFNERRAWFVNLWTKVGRDLPPDIYVTHQFLLSFRENIKISQKHKNRDLKVSLF